MILTLSHVAEQPRRRADTSARWWPVTLTDAEGAAHELRLPYEQGQPAPAWPDVATRLAALPDGHDLAGARLERRVTTRAFAFRLRSSEKRAIRDADQNVGDWTDAQREVAGDVLTEMDQATYIDVALPLTELLVRRLEREGLITEGRSDEILSA